MSDVNTTVAESSPATPTDRLETPKDPAAYDKWRRTGELPETTKPKPAEPAPAKTSEAGEDPAENSAPASDAGNERQEQRSKHRDNAESRLKDILSDLKKAGLSPAELKTFKREAQQQEAKETPKADPPKEAAKPAEDPTRPKKPSLETFDSYPQYEAALDKYYEDLADWKAESKLKERDAKQQQEQQVKELSEKITSAKQRYGDEAGETIREASKILLDDQIPVAVRAIIDKSPVVVDLLYTMGLNSEEMSSFIALAKSDPLAAIRKAVVMEHLITQELAKPANGDKGRDEDGKFTKTAAPVKKVTDAPPPPKEASGRSASPPDPVDSAIRSNDFEAFRDARNRADLARRSGR